MLTYQQVKPIVGGATTYVQLNDFIQQNADWNEANPLSVKFIENKPTIPTPITNIDQINTRSYNDLQNLPDLSLKIENIDVENELGSLQFITTNNNLRFRSSDFNFNTISKTIELLYFGNPRIWYISENGSDTFGVEGDPNRPFATFAGALANGSGLTSRTFVFTTRSSGVYDVGLSSVNFTCNFILYGATINLNTSSTTNQHSFIGVGSRNNNIIQRSVNATLYISYSENITFNLNLSGASGLIFGDGRFYNCILNNARLIGVSYVDNSSINNSSYRCDNGVTFNNSMLNIVTGDGISLTGLSVTHRFLNSTLTTCAISINSTVDSIIRTLNVDIQNCKINNSKFQRGSSNVSSIPRIVLTYKNNELIGDNFIKNGQSIGDIRVYVQKSGGNIGTFAVVETNVRTIIEQTVGSAEIIDANFILI